MIITEIHKQKRGKIKMKLKQYAPEELEALPTSQLGSLYRENYLTPPGDAKARSQLEKIVQVLRTRPISEREEVYYSMKNEAMAIGKQTSGVERFLLTHPLVRLCRYYIEDVLQPNPADESNSQDKK